MTVKIVQLVQLIFELDVLLLVEMVFKKQMKPVIIEMIIELIESVVKNVHLSIELFAEMELLNEMKNVIYEKRKTVLMESTVQAYVEK
ncbi:hypothetical protein IKO18_05925 [bacterium]|nr:hypothetical protein [bacterium]